MGNPTSKPILPIKPKPSILGQVPLPNPPSKPSLGTEGRLSKPSIIGSNTADNNPVTARQWPRSIDRTLRIYGKEVNVTGFYEQVPSNKNENSGFTLQLNQVGFVFVGWFSEVSDVVPNVSLLKTMKSLPSLTRIGFGVLTGYGSSLKVSQNICYIEFQWDRVEAKKGEINKLDPGANTTASVDQGTGLLRLQPVTSQEFEISKSSSILPTIFPRATYSKSKDWIVTGINFSGRLIDGFEDLKLTKVRPRLSFNLIQQQGELLRDALIATNVSILPESYINSLLRRVIRIFRYGIFGLENDIPPTTEADIDLWIKAEKEAEKKAPRYNVLSTLSSFHTDIAKLPYLFQREQIRDQFIVNAQNSTKRMGDQDFSYYKIYQLMMAEEVDQVNTSENTFLRSILDLGTFPSFSSKSKRYRYTLDFTAVPSVNDKLKIPLGPIALGGGVYTIGIKRETVEFEIEPDGSIKMDKLSGNPLVKTIVNEADLSKGIKLTDKHLAFIVSAGVNPSADPVKVDLYTPLGDISYDDFIDAKFNFVSVTGSPKITFGKYAELKPISTGYFNITLTRRNNLELWGSITEMPGIKLTTIDQGKNIVDKLSKRPESLSELKKLRDLGKPYYDQLKEKGAQQGAEEWISDFKLDSWKFDFSKILSIGTGFGIISNSQKLNSKIDSVTTPDTPARLVEDSHQWGSEKIANFFNKDDASIDNILQAKENSGLVEFENTRILLELFLATNLYLLLNPEGELILHGYASPEGPAGPLQPEVDDPYNVELSNARVDNVYRAIIDAMLIWENRWTRNLESEGRGEVPSRRDKSRGGGGLIDPPSSSNKAIFRIWCKNHRQEVEQWPEWRRVDLKLGSFASLRLYE